MQTITQSPMVSTYDDQGAHMDRRTATKVRETPAQGTIPEYGGLMATKKVTITIPEELLESARALTDNISGFAAEAFEHRIRRELLAEEMRRYQEEHGEFTEEEIAAARARLHGKADAKGAAA